MSKSEYNFVEQIQHYVGSCFEIVLLCYTIWPWKICCTLNKHASLYYTPVRCRKMHIRKNKSMLQPKDLTGTTGLKYDSIFIFSFNKQYLTTTTSPAYNLLALYQYQPFFTLLNKPLSYYICCTVLAVTLTSQFVHIQSSLQCFQHGTT